MTNRYPMKRHNVVRPTEQFLRQLFEKYGNIMDVVVREYTIHQTQNRQEGYGFITFSSDESATVAVSECSCLIVDGIIVNATMSHRHINSPKSRSGPGSVTISQPLPSPNNVSMQTQNFVSCNYAGSLPVSHHSPPQQYYNPANSFQFSSHSSPLSSPMNASSLDPYLRQHGINIAQSPSSAYRMQQLSKASPRFVQQQHQQQHVPQQQFHHALQHHSPRFQHHLLHQQQLQMMHQAEESGYFGQEPHEIVHGVNAYGSLDKVSMSTLSDSINGMSLGGAAMTESPGVVARKQQLFPPPIHIPPADQCYYPPPPPQPSPRQYRLPTNSSSCSSPSIRHSSLSSSNPSPIYSSNSTCSINSSGGASTVLSGFVNSSSTISSHLPSTFEHNILPPQPQSITPLNNTYQGLSFAQNSSLGGMNYSNSSAAVFVPSSRNIHLPFEPSLSKLGTSFAGDISDKSATASLPILDEGLSLGDFNLVPSIQELDKAFT